VSDLETLVRSELVDYFEHLKKSRTTDNQQPEFASAAHLSAAMKLLFRKGDDADAENPMEQAIARARELDRRSGQAPPEGLPHEESEEA